MKQGKFEEDIKKKLEGESSGVPNTVWDNIEAELNIGLVKSYRSKSNRYKWTSVAAILIAICSLAGRFFTFEPTEEQLSGFSGYNALLGKKHTIPGTPEPGWSSKGFPVFKPVIIHERNDVLIAENPSALDSQKDEGRSPLEIHRVASKRYPEYSIALNGDIYPYIQAFSGNQSISKEHADDATLWAGVTAGAGNFNSINSNPLTSGVNLIGLASAMGNDGFINPSTLVTPEFNSGLATSIGIDLGMKLGRKWALEAGVSYTNVTSNGKASINIQDTYILDVPITTASEEDEAIVPSSSREAELFIQETSNHDVAVSGSTQFTSVPVRIGYFLLDRKMSLKLNVGFAANYFVTSDLRDKNDIIEGSLDNSFNEWSFDGIGGIEIGYAVFRNLDFVLEPNYRQAITPMTIGSASNNRFIVQTGLKYTLQ